MRHRISAHGFFWVVLLLDEHGQCTTVKVYGTIFHSSIIALVKGEDMIPWPLGVDILLLCCKLLFVNYVITKNKVFRRLAKCGIDLEWVRWPT